MAAIRGFIKTEQDYEAAMEQIEAFFADMPKPGTRRGDAFELLAFLVSKYETECFPIREVDAVELLHFAIEDMGRSQAELARLVGSRGRASEILRRKRPLTLDQIRILSEAWRLPVEVLARPYRLEKEAA